jgi:hypothetical protein
METEVILFKARIRGATDSKSHQESTQQQRGGGGDKRFPHFLGSLCLVLVCLSWFLERDCNGSCCAETVLGERLQVL